MPWSCLYSYPSRLFIVDSSGEGMFVQPHTEQDDQREDNPRSVGCNNNCQVQRAILPERLFAQDHDEAGNHRDRVDDARQANPLFALDIGIGGDQIKRPLEQVIQPDRYLEKDGASHQQRVEVAAPPVNRINDRPLTLQENSPDPGCANCSPGLHVFRVGAIPQPTCVHHSSHY